MAKWTVANGSNHNVLNWERRLNLEALKMTQFSKWFGTGMDSGIRIVSDLQRGQGNMGPAGDTVYTTLLMNLSGVGVAGDADMQGNEEDLVLHRQTVTINQLRQAVKSAGKITQQRAFLNFREEARGVLQKWGSDTMDKWAANQLAGNTGASSNNIAGMQTPTAPTSASGNMRILYGPTANNDTTEASLSATSTGAFQLTMIDEAIAIAETSSPAIEPLSTSDGPKYVAILHPYQIYSLKTDATAARVTWYDYHKSVIEGGGNDMIGNPRRGALGEYANCLIFSDSRIPLAPSTTRVRRAVFMGAQAGTLAFGADSGDNTNLRFRFIMQEEDYKNRLGVGVQVIGGLKKNVYNSIDFSTIVMSSYAAAP